MLDGEGEGFDEGRVWRGDVDKGVPGGGGGVMKMT